VKSWIRVQHGFFANPSAPIIDGLRQTGFRSAACRANTAGALAHIRGGVDFSACPKSAFSP